MEVKEMIMEVLKLKGMSQSDLCSRMNITRQALYSRLNHGGNMGIKTISYMLSFVDYRIVVVPRSAKLPKDSFDITEFEIPVSNDGRRK